MSTIKCAACMHPETRQIFEGDTHADAWMEMAPRGVSYDQFIDDLWNRFGDDIFNFEGFLTDDDRFVDRTEAMAIAKESHQTYEHNADGGYLLAEYLR